jgi:hypothetical protein
LDSINGSPRLLIENLANQAVVKTKSAHDGPSALKEGGQLDGVELEIVRVAQVVARALAQVLAKLGENLGDLLVAAEKVPASLASTPRATTQEASK